MEDYYLGTILMFGGNFAPKNFEFCNGQLLSISSNQALFAVIGVTYGGDGVNNFALPDLRGRAPLHFGAGPGLTPRQLGEVSGYENVTLDITQMPVHSHTSQNTLHGSEEANVDDPTGNFIAGTGNQTFGTTADIALNSGSVESSIGNAGSSQPHYNMQPYLGLNFIICVSGLFPSRT